MPISEISIGDELYTENGSCTTVKMTSRAQASVMLSITLSTEDVVLVTPGHRVCLNTDENQRYVSADALKVGDVLRSSNRQDVAVRSIDTINQEFVVYNIGLQSGADYFVSHSSIQVEGLPSD